MEDNEFKQYFERNRPHIHPPDSVFFITFRLIESIPKATIESYKAEKQWLENHLQTIKDKKETRPTEILKIQYQSTLAFQRTWFKNYEDILDKASNGTMWLKIEDIRNIVAEKLLKDDNVKYRLDAFCIMSNHVHIVLKPKISEHNLLEKRVKNKVKFITKESTLPQIMQSLKGVTARKANLFLNRTGSFWEKESYDHFIRDEAEFYRIIKYTINNPVKAKLVKHWKDWAGTFLAERLKDKFKS